jgi:hypothetical protein
MIELRKCKTKYLKKINCLHLFKKKKFNFKKYLFVDTVLVSKKYRNSRFGFKINELYK